MPTKKSTIKKTKSTTKTNVAKTKKAKRDVTGAAKNVEPKTQNPQSKTENLKQPIVAVMGHVDHGKTSFLDAVRGTKVAAKEYGGITQNTRAHEVVAPDGFKITFIDTPGHEAFSMMRDRGARVTDFVLLMVAADDGVQPQTKESIEFAKKNNVPIIVAINKIDLPGVNTQKIKTELSSFGVVVEEYGGDVLSFEISATKNIGLNDVLEGIELMTELNELKAKEPKEGVMSEAFVLESTLDKKAGYSALCILKAGELNDRLFGVTKDSIFKVRAYMNEEGKPIATVHNSQPFTVLGLRSDLKTGEIINFVKTEDEAKALKEKLTEGEVVEDETTLDAESLFAQMLIAKEEMKQGVEQKKLNLIIRSSTQGTLEAVIAQLEKLKTPEAAVKILSSGTGTVTEDDINFAKVARAIVISFQSKVPKDIESLAKRNKVILREYQIIYKLVEEIEDVLGSLDQPMEEEVELARLKVKAIFTLSDGSQVAGGNVTKGTFVKNYQVRVERESNRADEVYEIGTAKIKMIKQSKDEVKEAKKGQECGLLFDKPIEDLQEGDEVIAFRMERM